MSFDGRHISPSGSSPRRSGHGGGIDREVGDDPKDVAVLGVRNGRPAGRGYRGDRCAAVASWTSTMPVRGRFVGVSNGPAASARLRGHIAAQAFAAACRTAGAELRPTSLHAVSGAGDAATGTHYDVEIVYDGRTSASRRALAVQDGRLLLVATARSRCQPRAGPTDDLGDPR